MLTDSSTDKGSLVRSRDIVAAPLMLCLLSHVGDRSSVNLPTQKNIVNHTKNSHATKHRNTPVHRLRSDLSKEREETDTSRVDLIQHRENIDRGSKPSK